MGTVEGIYRASSASQPMEALEKGRLHAGVGLEGDRYANNVGTYSVFRASKLQPGQQELGRQLTLVSADSVRHVLGDVLRPKDLRRNIAITGISSQELVDAVGHVIQLGETCRVLVHRSCVPCIYNEKKNGVPKLMEKLWHDAGVSCEILQGGEIHLGSLVTILPNETGIVDEGRQAPGFFVHPSERNASILRKALDEKRLLQQHLESMDQEGLARLEKSYNSVGLTFWSPPQKGGTAT